MVTQLICRNSEQNRAMLLAAGWAITYSTNPYVYIKLSRKFLLATSVEYFYIPTAQMLIYPRQLSELLLMPSEESYLIMYENILKEHPYE